MSRFNRLLELTKASVGSFRSFVSEHKGIERLTHTINVITGYAACERLRQAVQNCDSQLGSLKGDLLEARLRYRKAITERSSCQKEINSLLQRKSAWQDTELTRFTDLYRREMQLEQQEAEGKSENEILEKQVDDAHQALIDAMRERYQGEQAWSDKTRRASTFASVGLMTLNILLFLILQLFIEPRKRRKLVKEFVEAQRTLSPQ